MIEFTHRTVFIYIFSDILFHCGTNMCSWVNTTVSVLLLCLHKDTFDVIVLYTVFFSTRRFTSSTISVMSFMSLCLSCYYLRSRLPRGLLPPPRGPTMPPNPSGSPLSGRPATEIGSLTLPPSSGPSVGMLESAFKRKVKLLP